MLELSDEEIIRNQREMFYDKSFDAALEQAALEGTEEGGDMAGGDLAGGDLAGGDLAGGDLGAGDAGEVEGADALTDEEETLLATPGKRNDLEWKKASDIKPDRSKGKVYKPVKSDKRDMGARNRSWKSQYANEVGKNTERNIFKGSSELNRLARGIYEDIETSYSAKFEDDEKRILQNDGEIQKLIENLNNKGKK